MQRIIGGLTLKVVFSILAVLLCQSLQAQKFYPDDPLQEEPPPFPTVNPQFRALSEFVDLFENTFRIVGERHPGQGVILSRGVNTVGDVMDGPWYANRYDPRRNTLSDLARMSEGESSPSKGSPWQVLTVKGFGTRPGMLIRDGNKRLYLLRFDPPGHLEMATGAAMVASRFFHALGYHVPENSIVYFQREQLVPHSGGTQVTSHAEQRGLTDLDIDEFLRQVAADVERGYRALAIRIPPNWKKLLGPFQLHGVRSDDPNDIVPHEHRRDLRGLFVFASWLNYTDLQATDTLDVLVEEDGVPYIKHFWMDLAGTLGSGGDGPKRAEAGNEPLLDGRQALRNTLGAGIYTPEWMRTHYPAIPSVRNFEGETFHPLKWTTSYPLAPFENRLPDDDFWAARKVMSFSDEAIRLLVKAGQYSDPRAADWLASSLITRRDRIGRAYFSGVLPLDGFEVRHGELVFQDLSVQYGFSPPRSYSVRWSRFDNPTMVHSPVGPAATSNRLPAEAGKAPVGSYWSARISSEEPGKEVTVFLRKERGRFRVAGVEWGWAGKASVAPEGDVGPVYHRYADLHPIQKELLEKYVADFNRTEGYTLTAFEFFESLTVSERTTFDSVTHALVNTELTGGSGQPLGKAIDLLEGLERVAGQDAGKRRDQQFRLYSTLKPGAVQKLEESRQFFRDHENSSYHAGYPICYRLGGNVPSLQFSVSADGTRADIDIDYRSSGWPNALFNGHLKTANSDVRAGGNARKHNRRWAGLIEWWQGETPETGPVEARAAATPQSPTVSASTSQTSAPAEPDERRR